MRQAKPAFNAKIGFLEELFRGHSKSDKRVEATETCRLADSVDKVNVL